MELKRFVGLVPLVALGLMLLAAQPLSHKRVVLEQGVKREHLTLTNFGQSDFRLKRTHVDTEEVVDSSKPFDHDESNIEFTFGISGPKAHKAKAHKPTTKPGVVEIDLKGRKPRTFQLHQMPGLPVSLKPRGAKVLRKTQALSAEYLESVGINTGDGSPDDHRVTLGERNPSLFVAAGRQAPDLMPNDPPTAEPPRHGGKLLKLGVNTGEKHDNWDDDNIKVRGTEEPYNWGSSPDRDTRSPNQRDGGWGWI